MKKRKIPTPKKSPPPPDLLVLENRHTLSASEIGYALRVDEKTVRRWAGLPQDEYPVPHSRDGYGDAAPLLFNLFEVKEWQLRTGRDGSVGRPELKGGFSFWAHTCFEAYEPASQEKLTTDFERDLMSGARTLDADELRDYANRRLWHERHLRIGHRTHRLVYRVSRAGDAKWYGWVQTLRRRQHQRRSQSLEHLRRISGWQWAVGSDRMQDRNPCFYER